jgi:hypothetical protein
MSMMKAVLLGAGSLGLIGGVAWALSPSAPSVGERTGSPAQVPKPKFRVGDLVTVTGEPNVKDAKGFESALTHLVTDASWDGTTWQYRLGPGQPKPQGSLHMHTPVP